ncbi:hypothetical protein SDC9_169509 [bioreactor metagenome]|uniref:Uncharacterized protein n=1 Tax=bioreactor metagenome TaxID=1076179 RepID=A0A645G7L0_9ZZZZ
MSLLAASSETLTFAGRVAPSSPVNDAPLTRTSLSVVPSARTGFADRTVLSSVSSFVPESTRNCSPLVAERVTPESVTIPPLRSRHGESSPSVESVPPVSETTPPPRTTNAGEDSPEVYTKLPPRLSVAPAPPAKRPNPPRALLVTLLSCRDIWPPDTTATAALVPAEKSLSASPVLLRSALFIVSTPAFSTSTVFSSGVLEA